MKLCVIINEEVDGGRPKQKVENALNKVFGKDNIAVLYMD